MQAAYSGMQSNPRAEGQNSGQSGKGLFASMPALRQTAGAKLLRLICALLAMLAFAATLRRTLSPQAAPAPFSFDPKIIFAVSAGIAAFAAIACLLVIIHRRSERLAAANAVLEQKLNATWQEMQNYAVNADAPASAKMQTETAEQKPLAALLNAVTMPLVLRDEAGKTLFRNKAADELLSGHKAAENIQDIDSLFSPALQKSLRDSRAAKQNFSGRSNVIVKGDRHIFLCRSLYDANAQCFLEIAEDITEKTNLRQDAARIKQGYAETFDRLSTSVAIFDPAQKLEFFNPAFKALWPLDDKFLESCPSNAVLLDRLREKGILSERPDWRQWKDQLFESYRSLEPQHYLWNLTDGRTLRVVANPHPQGGVTWLFDDLTEKISLESRYKTLIRMQGETLDSLSEGVAVFSSDGRLRLANPAFSALWNFPPDLAIEKTHIEKIKAFAQNGERAAAPAAEAANPPRNAGAETAGAVWDKIAFYITDIADKRDPIHGRAELADRRIFDYALTPLPQGQTMLSFVNVTDSVNIARVLHERNAALESADRLRNAFIQHVSYELRTPLTNIMGFTDLLRSGVYGAMSRNQAGCLSDIAAQSRLLYDLVNDILDLATVDAGIMELNISGVPIEAAMRAAGERVSKKLAAKNVTLEEYIAPDLSSFEADEARIRQIFVNLLNNAAAAAPENSRIFFRAEMHKNYIQFSVEDEGKGILPERRETIFKRFTSYSYEGQKTGIGLGLSIVKSFTELHQGHILVEEGEHGGTKFICRFPFHESEQKFLPFERKKITLQ